MTIGSKEILDIRDSVGTIIMATEALRDAGLRGDNEDDYIDMIEKKAKEILAITEEPMSWFMSAERQILGELS